MTRIGVTGHQNIPAEAIEFISASVRDLVRKAPPPVVGLSSLAEGADQLFADAVTEAGGHLNVVVPSRDYERTFASKPARTTYRRLLALASEVHELEFAEPTEAAFLAAGVYIVDHCELLIAVWDGAVARGRGGTGDIVDYARQRQRQVEVVWPKGVTR